MTWTETIDGCGCCSDCEGKVSIYITYDQIDTGDPYTLAELSVYWISADGHTTIHTDTYTDYATILDFFPDLPEMLPGSYAPPITQDIPYELGADMMYQYSCGTIGLRAGTTVVFHWIHNVGSPGGRYLSPTIPIGSGSGDVF